MTRVLAILAVVIGFCGLAACTSSGPLPNGPHAPGVSSRGASEDAVLVGHRLMRAGEYELAIKAFGRAALDEGMSSEILLGFGSAYLGLGRVGQAEDLLRRAVDKDERSPEAWNNLGVALMEQGAYPEAEQVFRRAYALDNGQSDSVRDNLRLALAERDRAVYDSAQSQGYKLVRRGGSDYLIRATP